MAAYTPPAVGVGTGAETDGEGEGLGVPADDAAPGEAGGDTAAVAEGEGEEHEVCETMIATASTPPSGAAARFLEGARRQKLSACLRCARG